jgi:phenylacetate-CoA ligase
MGFWESEIEQMGRKDLEALQLKRLQETVGRVEKAPFYKNIFSVTGIKPDSISSLADIRRLPLTSKDDLRAGQPGDFLAVPQSEVVRLHASSGTTGKPTAVMHTQSDLNAWTNLVARSLCMAGMTRDDVFQNMVGYGLFTGGLGLHYGAEKLGATVIPAGVGNSRRQINLMQQFHTTALHIIPSYALKLLETLHGLGMDPARDLDLKMAVIGAEPHSEETRLRLQETYGIKAFNCYGLSEMNGPAVGFECDHQTGLHIWEDSFYLEILDPDTLEPVPEGEIGEIVLTTLCREAMPLIRYRTKDLARIETEPCPCGRVHRRLSRIQGRSDDMLILKGVNIFPVQIEHVLMANQHTGGNYVIVLDKEGPLDTMIVRVEMSRQLTDASPDQVRTVERDLSRLLKDEILISPKVELVEPNGLASGEGKAVRVIDNRG